MPDILEVKGKSGTSLGLRPRKVSLLPHDTFQRIYISRMQVITYAPDRYP